MAVLVGAQRTHLKSTQTAVRGETTQVRNGKSRIVTCRVRSQRCCSADVSWLLTSSGWSNPSMWERHRLLPMSPKAPLWCPSTESPLFGLLALASDGLPSVPNDPSLEGLDIAKPLDAVALA